MSKFRGDKNQEKLLVLDVNYTPIKERDYCVEIIDIGSLEKTIQATLRKLYLSHPVFDENIGVISLRDCNEGSYRYFGYIIIENLNSDEIYHDSPLVRDVLDFVELVHQRVFIDGYIDSSDNFIIRTLDQKVFIEFDSIGIDRRRVTLLPYESALPEQEYGYTSIQNDIYALANLPIDNLENIVPLIDPNEFCKEEEDNWKDKAIAWYGNIKSKNNIKLISVFLLLICSYMIKNIFRPNPIIETKILTEIEKDKNYDEIGNDWFIDGRLTESKNKVEEKLSNVPAEEETENSNSERWFRDGREKLETFLN